MNKVCPICQGRDVQLIYQANNIPVFQNKVYSSENDALSCQKGDIQLMQCECGFAYNNTFDEKHMTYDNNYQNEQSHSVFFMEHLDWVCEFILSKVNPKSHICEIGCGKGFFLEQLRHKGLPVIGYDPTFEGEAAYVVKEYFSEKTLSKKAHLIVLRHVLEHVKDPYTFLEKIANTNKYQGKIYIEVPCFEWIQTQNAFWDINYEHVNYFSKQTFQNIFPHAEVGNCFGEQYLYVLADLSDLTPRSALSGISVNRIKNLATNSSFRILSLEASHVYVWGAGAKGNIYCNLIDKEVKIVKAVIDANPKKQQKFMAGTAHPIISPEDFMQRAKHTKIDLIIMNHNYYYEIKESLHNFDLQYHILEQSWTTEKNSSNK